MTAFFHVHLRFLTFFLGRLFNLPAHLSKKTTKKTHTQQHIPSVCDSFSEQNKRPTGLMFSFFAERKTEARKERNKQTHEL